MHDESLRRWTHVIIRIASDEREFVFAVRCHFVYIMRINNFERGYAVTIRSGSGVEQHFSARRYLAQRPKESVPMAREHHISRLRRPGRAWNVSNANAQNLRSDAFENNGRKADTRNLKPYEPRSRLRGNTTHVLGRKIYGSSGRGLSLHF